MFVVVVVVLVEFEFNESESTALFIFAWDNIELIVEPFVVVVDELPLLLIKFVELVGPFKSSVLLVLLLPFCVEFKVVFEILEVVFKGTVVVLFVDDDVFIDEQVVVDAFTAAEAAATPAKVAAAVVADDADEVPAFVIVLSVDVVKWDGIRRLFRFGWMLSSLKRKKINH